jgi:hypothetical protein
MNQFNESVRLARHILTQIFQQLPGKQKREPDLVQGFWLMEMGNSALFGLVMNS